MLTLKNILDKYSLPFSVVISLALSVNFNISGIEPE